MKLSLCKASFQDGQELCGMQCAAFRELLEKYRDYETNPAAEKLERVLIRLKERGSSYYFIRLDGRKAGALRVVQTGDACRLSLLFLLPEYQGNGYAQQAIEAVEALYPNVKSWNLDTIKQEPRLCHLYEKMGYHQTRTERPIKDGMTLVFYEKPYKILKG